MRTAMFFAAVLLAVVPAVAGCAGPSGNAADPGTLGATGNTIVPGSTSTIAGDARATYYQQVAPQGRLR